MSSSTNQFYVVFFDTYVSIAPETWIDKDNKIIYWPVKPVKNTKKMCTMRVEDDWAKHHVRKFLGPFG